MAFAVGADKKDAVDFRAVERFATMGYSWGGGAAHDLIERVSNDGYLPFFSVYLAAVVHGAVFNSVPQDDWPSESLYLLNIWQPNGDFELGGGPIVNPEELSPFSN